MAMAQRCNSNSDPSHQGGDQWTCLHVQLRQSRRLHAAPLTDVLDEKYMQRNSLATPRKARIEFSSYVTSVTGLDTVYGHL